jgi:hypothetical protein
MILNAQQSNNSAGATAVMHHAVTCMLLLLQGELHFVALCLSHTVARRMHSDVVTANTARRLKLS